MTPFSATKSTMPGSRTNSCAMFTPNGLSVSVAHLLDLVADLVELARRRLDDAEPAGVRHRRRELGPGDEAHRRLHDRMLDSQQLRDSGAHGVARYPHDRESPTATPVILEVALNGVTSRRRNPHVPATVEEHAKRRARVRRRGRDVIHTHAPEHRGRRPRKRPSSTRPRSGPVVEKHPGIICYPTVGLRRHDRGSVPPRRAPRRHGPRRARVRRHRLGQPRRHRPLTGSRPRSEFVYTNTFAKIAPRDAGVHRPRSRPERGDLRAGLPAGRARVLARGRAPARHAREVLFRGRRLPRRRRSAVGRAADHRSARPLPRDARRRRRSRGRWRCSAARCSTRRSRAPRSNAAGTCASGSKTGTTARRTSSRSRPPSRCAARSAARRDDQRDRGASAPAA